MATKCVWYRAEFCLICSLLEQQLALLPSWHCHVNYVQRDSVPWCHFLSLMPSSSISHPLLCLRLLHHLCFFLLFSFLCMFLHLLSICLFVYGCLPFFTASLIRHPCHDLDPVLHKQWMPSSAELSQLPCCLRSIKFLSCSKVKYLCSFGVKQITSLTH